MNKFEEAFLAAVHALVLVVCLVFWAIVGFIFWIPLLTRTTAIYCAGMVAAVISQTDSLHLKGLLNVAIEFYARGFRQITTHYRDARKANSLSFSSNPLPKVEWSKVWVEIIWTSIFWVLILGLSYAHAIENLLSNA